MSGPRSPRALELGCGNSPNVSCSMREFIGGLGNSAMPVGWQ